MIQALRRSRAPRATGAFTLIELVLTVAIVATLGGLLIATMQGVEGHASTDLGRRELDEVRKAILRFKADTGFLPKRGPFNLETRAAQDGGRVQVADLPGAPSDPEAWFDAPANLWQLYECPLPTGDPLATWNPDRRRGWNGPYLPRGAEGLVAVSPDLSPEGTTAWPAGALMVPFPAVADAFVLPLDPDIGFVWTAWGGKQMERHGRPLLVFDLDPGLPGSADDRDAQGNDLVAQRARVVSVGSDGKFSPISSGECVTGDDLGMYLLR